jgi:stalled ribosome rescue protein Dom34
MNIQNNLGIWMDHSNVHLIDIDDENNNKIISSNFTHSVKVKTLNKSESIMHNKEQQMHEAFYKEISQQILHYNNVLLFGPTNAKTELHNYLNKDLHFKEIKITVEPSDKVSEKEKIAFVKNFFT